MASAMIKIFGDSADLEEMHSMSKKVQGWTTNPTLMRKAGVRNYRAFAQRVLHSFPEYPISFEVFADELPHMEAQAREIDTWGENVYVKIPVVNTKGFSTARLITDLASAGIKVNVTAVMCYKQIDEVMGALLEAPAIVSIFAGRIADTGRSPIGIVEHAVKRKVNVAHQILWASPRQVLDVYTADSIGCDIITITKDILQKMKLEGKNLIEYSRETAEMFYNDARAAGYSI